MSKWLYSIGEFAARKAWAVIAIWVLVIAGVGTSFAVFHGQLKNSFTMPGTETQQLSDELAARFPDANRGTGQVIVTTADGSRISEEQQKAFVTSLDSLKDEVTSVDGVNNPFETAKKLEDGKKQLAEGKKKISAAPTQLKDGKKQLAEGQKKIDDGKKQLAEGQKKIDDGKKQLATAKTQLENSQAQATSGKNQVDSGQSQLDTSKKQLADAQQKLDASFASAQAQGSPASLMDPLNQQQQQLNAQRTELNTKQAELNTKRSEVDAAQAKVNAGRTEQATKQAELDKSQAQLASKKKELEDGQKKLDEKKAELAKAEKSFPTQQEDFARKEALFELTSDYRMVSEDGSTAIAGVFFTTKTQEISAADKEKVMEHFRGADLKGLNVYFDQNIAESPGAGMGPGEIIGIIVAFIVLIIMLGTLIAAGLPILMALIGVAVGVLATLSFSSLIDMSSTTYILGMMLGLAVGIDYSLFILNRHRINLMNGIPLRKSIALANGTSGNAVVFAGITVIIALVALNVAGIPFLGYMGDAGALCVAVAVLVSVTLTPAMLSIIGTKALPKKKRNPRQKSWAAIDTPEKMAARKAGEEKREVSPHGWLKLVLARPVLTIVASVLALVVTAIPMTQLRMGLPSAESSPVESTEYQAYQLVKDKFGEGMSGPVVAVAHTPEGLSDAQAEQAQVDIANAIKEKDSENVQTVVPAGQTDDHTLQIFQVVPKHGPSSVETVNLVNQLREVKVDVQGHEVGLGVTGLTGGNIDVSNVLAQKLPLYLAVVIGLSFLVLILVFRSLLVPLVASVGFLFSILASFGAVVAVYQMGFMGALFGVHDPGPILAFLPTLMVGILFGLAMDYQVFLVSGMREAYVHGKDAKTAVIAGYNHAVYVVVAAMIIMISVFGGFIFAESAMIRPIGFGLAFGVLVDAFVVRMTLTPAVMTLLGDKAWWLPKWLDKILPNMDVEGAALTEQVEEELAQKTHTQQAEGAEVENNTEAEGMAEESAGEEPEAGDAAYTEELGAEATEAAEESEAATVDDDVDVDAEEPATAATEVLPTADNAASGRGKAKAGKKHRWSRRGPKIADSEIGEVKPRD